MLAHMKYDLSSYKLVVTEYRDTNLGKFREKLKLW